MSFIHDIYEFKKSFRQIDEKTQYVKINFYYLFEVWTINII